MRNSGGAYQAASKGGWLDDVCSHMKKRGELISNARRKWTKESVAAVAKNYSTRTEFQYSKEHSGAYRRAQRDGYLDEVCFHMVKVDHGYLHCVYVILNEESKKAYVGITRATLEQRKKQHQSKKNQTNSFEIAKLSNTIFKKLTDYIYPPDKVKFIEAHYIGMYKELGYEVLNSEKSVGTVGYRDAIWTFEKVAEEAKKYQTRTEFQKNSKAAWSRAQYKGWMDRVCGHMLVKKRPNGYWTLDRLKGEAKKYKTRKEFQRGCLAAYDFAYRHGMLDEVCAHMRRVRAKPASC